MTEANWQGAGGIPSRSYTCGYCGNALASNVGYWAHHHGNHNVREYLCICHFCWQPTFFDFSGMQTPGVAFGNPVKDVPEETVNVLYDEARRATGAGSYTAAVLCCRKLLMHIAVSKGAPTGKNFVSYVEYLGDNHYVPPDARVWVDHIRQRGNEANHEILIMKAEDAEELLSFLEMLLKVIYEFPAAIRRKIQPPAQ